MSQTLSITFQLLLWSLAVHACCQAQAFAHRFRHWNAGQGLGSTTCLSLAKGKDGYLWVGTAAGLQPFNGSRFQSAVTPGSGATARGRYSALTVAHDGSLWAAVDQAGLAVLSPEKSVKHQRWYRFGEEPGGNWPPSSANVRALLCDPAGKIWLGTENEGLYQLNPSTGEKKRIVIDSTRMEYHRSVRSLYLLDSATILVGMVNGLLLVHLADERLSYPAVTTNYSGRQPSYWHFAPWRTDTLLAATDRGIFLVDSRNWRVDWYRLPSGDAFLSYYPVTRVLPVSEQECWIATENLGLIFLNLASGEWSSAKDAGRDAIGSAKIHDLFRDDQGFIWVAHDEGLSCYDSDNNLAKAHPVPLILSFRQHMMAAVAPNGNLWFPFSAGFGILPSTGDREMIYREMKVPDGFVRRQYLLWHPRYGPVMMTRNGIWRADTLTWTYRPWLTWEMPDVADAGSRVEGVLGRSNHIWVDSSGTEERWWFAAQEMYRLACFLPAHNRLIYYNSLKLADNPQGYGSELNRFARDANGGLWVASQTRGLYYLPDANVDFSLHFWSGAEGRRNFPFNTVKDLYFDEERGELWATVGGAGLAQIEWRQTDSLRYRIYGAAEGLEHPDLFRIVPVDGRYFFMGSSNGIHAFDRETSRFYLFNWRYGLSYSSFFPGFGEYLNGRCWFAAPGHFVSFNPHELLQARRYVPRLVLYAWHGGRREAVGNAGPPLRLSFESRDLLVEPDLIDFQQSENYRIQYRLRGLDNGWTTVQAGTQVAYSNLRGGNYRFECRLLDGAEPVGELYAFDLKVATPFYRSGWFFLALAAAVIAAAFAWMRGRQRRKLTALRHQNELLRMQAEQQQALLRERERITADLHDDVGATLSSLRLYGDLAGEVWDTQPQESRDLIRRMAIGARELVERMSDIVWSLRPPDEHTQSLEARLRDSARELLTPRGVHAFFDIDHVAVNMLQQPERRRNLLLLLREALHNVAKHSRATEVRVVISRQGEELVCMVEDNGRGFDVAANSSGNGLRNMSQRCRSIGGRFGIHSAPGHGTRVECRVPMATISHMT